MTLTDEERAEPRHHPDNYTAWNSYFLRRWGSSPPTTARRLRLRATTRAADVGGARRGRRRTSSRTSRRNFPCSQCPSIEGIGAAAGETSAATAHGCQLVVFGSAPRSSFAP
ncbi:hypothetical protein QYE76_035489 [Lolium multiflorum]|uniref:Uncharacterized protein n=1 Tax=Lolium multiflorum TaxID=4521 RepID=A0AAD8R108_LOLMU|nr:hypothetical protein QYE76_035489 [Lolium multiflorum]